MSKTINEPEEGARVGVYEIENLEGEKKQLVAQNFPQADAFSRMGAAYVATLDEWKAEQLKKLEAKKPEGSDKKGK